MAYFGNEFLPRSTTLAHCYVTILIIRKRSRYKIALLIGIVCSLAPVTIVQIPRQRPPTALNHTELQSTVFVDVFLNLGVNGL